MPQIGAVLVPINYHLTADDFAYLINHCGARVVCVHSDFLDAIEGIRRGLPEVQHFVALEGARHGWLDYESQLKRASSRFERREVRREVRVLTAGAAPAAATIERLEGEWGWEITQAYGLTETSPFITICECRPEHEGLPLSDRAVIKARQGVELITSGDLRVVDVDDREVPHDGLTLGEDVQWDSSFLLDLEY